MPSMRPSTCSSSSSSGSTFKPQRKSKLQSSKTRTTTWKRTPRRECRSSVVVHRSEKARPPGSQGRRRLGGSSGMRSRSSLMPTSHWSAYRAPTRLFRFRASTRPIAPRPGSSPNQGLARSPHQTHLRWEEGRRLRVHLWYRFSPMTLPYNSS